MSQIYDFNLINFEHFQAHSGIDTKVDWAKPFPLYSTKCKQLTFNDEFESYTDIDIQNNILYNRIFNCKKKLKFIENSHTIINTKTIMERNVAFF